MYYKAKQFGRVFIATALIIFILLAVVQSSAFATSATSTDGPSLALIDQKVRDFEVKYGIVVLYKDVPKKKDLTFSSKMTNKSINQQLDDMDTVLSTYPKDFAKTIKLKKIYLVKDLTSGKYSADGLSIASMFGPRLRESVIYLNVPSGNGAVYTLHHELMHTMEYAMPSDRQAWLKIVGSENDDIYWENASGDLSEYANRPGFVTNYAGYSVMEDRAETYAVMMASPYGEKALKRLREDEVVKAKAQFILAYCKKSFPNDTAFLSKVQAGYDAIYGSSSASTKTASQKAA